MYDHEKKVSCSYHSNSSEDRYGVSWGEKLPPLSRDKMRGKPKGIVYYSSFSLAGTKYFQNDTVYLEAGDGPPFIGRILDMYENVKIKEKRMRVRWFCRPCELPEGLPDVDYSENCKEVFMMWGDGAKNVNSPASTIKHCSVLCTAEEEWNTNYPSIEVIAAADHIFDRAIDSGTLRSVDDIVKQFGEYHVTGIGVASQRNVGSPRLALGSGKKKSLASGLHVDQPLPVAMREASDLPSRDFDLKHSEGPNISGFPSPNGKEHQPVKTAASRNSQPVSLCRHIERHMENLPLKSSPSAFQRDRHKQITSEARSARQMTADKAVSLQAAYQSSKRPHTKPVRKGGTLELQKRPRLDCSDPFLSQEGQEGFSETSKHKNSEVKKRSRVESNLETGKEKLKKSKLSIPSHILPADFINKVPRFRENGSTSIAISPKVGDLRSPTLAERNSSESDPRLQQSHNPDDVHQYGRHDSRGSCSPVGQRQSAKVGDENLFNLDSLQKQVRANGQSVGAEKHDTESRSPNALHLKHADQGIQHAHGGVQRSENLSAVHQNDAHMRHTDSDQGIKPFGKSHLDGLERLGQLRKQGCIDGVNATLPIGQKLSTSNHGKLPREEGLSSTSRKSRLLKESRQNADVAESHVKLSGDRKCFSSQRAGPSLVDTNYKEGNFPQKASMKSVHPELDVNSQKSNSRKSGMQPIELQTRSEPEGLEVNKIRSMARTTSTVSSARQDDQTTGPGSPRSRLVDNIVKSPTIENRKHGLELNESTAAPSDEVQRELFEPKKKIFHFPWQTSLRIALEQRKALLLRNLDPWFSSVEIETMLQELLQVSCDVRMLPPKNFTCYTSGQALVLFRTHNAAVEALRKFTDNWLIWSSDERPVVASMAEEETSRSREIHGFFSAEKFGTMGLTTKEKKNAGATSHCSQPNTAEYEMGIQWRLLQNRHTEAWTLAAQENNHKVDHAGHKFKQRKP